MEPEREEARSRLGPVDAGIPDSYKSQFYEKVVGDRGETPQLGDQMRKVMDKKLETWLWSRLDPGQFG